MQARSAAPAPPQRLGRAEWAVLIAAFLGWLFDGFEMGLFPLIQRPALQDLLGEVDDTALARSMGAITALFLFGAAAGGMIFGWLGDRIGRVRALSFSILTYSLFTGMGFFAAAPWHLGACRFAAALGMGGEWALGVALVMECWPERLRPLLAGAIGTAANFGFLLVGLLGFFFTVDRESWRWVMLVGAAPAILVFFIRLFVPESERWKSAVRHDAARPLREIARSPRLRGHLLLGAAISSAALIVTWGTVQWAPSWADKLTGGTLPSAKAVTVMCSALGAVLGSLAGGLLGGWLGRRSTYSILSVASLGACLLLYRGIPEEYGLVFQLTVFLVGGLTASFYGLFPLYLPELFPTRVRTTGQGVCYNCGRIFAGFGAIFSGELLLLFGGDYATMGLVISLVYVGGLAIVWLGPETRGRPLPQ